MRQIRVLRIVVASASDVQAERDAIPAVIEYLNKSVAKDRGLWLEVSRWETDAYPTFHSEGPQGAIDEILRIEDCDILIGIFWKRFGTPVKDAESGTEHEFQLAYDQWRNTGRPQIMFYFNQKSAAPKSKSETDQWGLVLEFKQRFPGEGLWWAYKNKAQFEDLLRNHLTWFILHQVPLPSQLYSVPPDSLPQESIEKVTDHARSVELSIEMSLARFHEWNRKVLRYVVSTFMDISSFEVEIVSAEEVRGSLQITLKLPMQSAERLLKAYEDKSSDFAGFLHAFAVCEELREHKIELHKNENKETSPVAANILIVSGESIISSALQMLIKTRQGLEVVGVADDMLGALTIAKDKRPDIIILDHHLRGRRTLLFIRRLIARAGGARVLVVTDDLTPESHHAAAALGISGIITRRNAEEELLQAIEKVRTGEVWVDQVKTGQIAIGAEHPNPIEIPVGHRLSGVLLSFRDMAFPSRAFIATSLLVVAVLAILVFSRSLSLSNKQERGINDHFAALNSTNAESPALTVDLQAPVLMRGGDESFNAIPLSVSTGHVVFLLHFPQGEMQELYDVSLVNSDGKVLFTVSGLKCSEGKKIPVKVIKEMIPRGDYFLTLSHGDEAPIYYMFRVIENY
jgi:DNA-binding NarL/FixJ family response regulator